MDYRDYPPFVDIHVHFRDPGMADAENRRTGAAAAAAGGIAAVVTMPNTTPAGDNARWLREQIEERDLPIAILPSAAITKGRLGEEVGELELLAEAGAAFFTDDGAYVKSDKVMEEAMKRAAAMDIAIADHAMDGNLLAGGVIRQCELARKLNLPIISSEVETAAIKRDLSLCRVTGCRLHIQHISTAEGVELVREAQKEGLRVTAEATPHHLLYSCDELVRDDANFKMAPPLGNKEDRFELRKAVKEGVLLFATDHAPHPARTKSRGFLESANGIIGLEAAIPVTYRVMVEEEGMREEDWAKAWWQSPRAVLSSRSLERLDSLKIKTRIERGGAWKIDVSKFKSIARNSPYDGFEYSARGVLVYG